MYVAHATCTFQIVPDTIKIALYKKVHLLAKFLLFWKTSCVYFTLQNKTRFYTQTTYSLCHISLTATNG